MQNRKQRVWNLLALLIGNAYFVTGIGTPTAEAASTPIFNCSSGFSTSGSCGVGFQATGKPFWTSSPSGLNGSDVIFVAVGSTHNGTGMFYQTPVNVQAFTTTFTFVPNGEDFTFVLQNNTNFNGAGTTNPQLFSGGAGCEAGFYQSFGTAPTSANNIVALEFDSYSSLTMNGSFTTSSVQAYQMNQTPCTVTGFANFWETNKISMSPVSLNSPATAQNTTTGDVYSATVSYDGTTLTLNLYDVTAGGTCPGAKCFTQTWGAINIPSLVGSNTAYAGFTSGIGLQTTHPLYVDSFSYAVNTPPARPSYSTYTTQSYMAGTTPAAAPIFSPVAGTYSGAQRITMSSTTSGNNICYILSASTPTLMPQTDNMGGCLVGTKYTGPVSVSSSQTLYAMAGTTFAGLPSSLTVGAYTIGTGTPPPSGGACDMNHDGAVNAADVQSAVNQALGIATCGTADLQSNGQCTAVDVQRVVNSVLGGQCVTGS